MQVESTLHPNWLWFVLPKSVTSVFIEKNDLSEEFLVEYFSTFSGHKMKAEFAVRLYSPPRAPHAPPPPGMYSMG